MAFVEVSDPKLVREAYENGLLYEERCVHGRTTDPIVPRRVIFFKLRSNGGMTCPE